MRYLVERRAGAALAAGLILWCAGAMTARADDPNTPGPQGRLARLFRSKGDQSAKPTSADNAATPTGLPPMPDPTFPPGSPTPAFLNNPATPSNAAGIYAGSGFGNPGPSTPPSSSGPANRIVPQPRNAKAATESDPLVTRISLGRSDSGGQFGMMMQVYADGTVIDGEGVHHVPRESLKPIVDAIQDGEILKQHGHCGGPPTDFVEQVHMVVYERNLGRLRASAFSYSGNTQGCDHSVRHVHKALDDIQAKISGTPSTSSIPAATASASQPMAAPHTASPAFPRNATRIGLSPR